MHVELLIGEQSTLASLNDVVDGDVVEYDSGVRTREFCSELAGDEFPVTNEFSRAVRKGEFDGFGCKLPHRGPLSSCGNMPFRVSHSKADFCVANASLSLFINCSVVDRGEEMVEIEDLSPEYPVPLRVENSSGSISGHADDSSSPRDIPEVNSDSFASLGEAGFTGIGRDWVGPTGWQLSFGELSFLRRRVVGIIGFD